MVSAEKGLISVFLFRNSLLLTLPWIFFISCKWKVHLRSVFVWSCHISSLNCLLSSPPPSPPPLQPQSIILVSPLIIHLRSSLPQSVCRQIGVSVNMDLHSISCYLFYHFLRWLNSLPGIWFLNHISNLRPSIWNGNLQKISHQSKLIVTKIRFYAFLEATEKKGVLLFSQGLRSVNMSITITLSSNISCCKTDSTDTISWTWESWKCASKESPYSASQEREGRCRDGFYQPPKSEQREILFFSGV